ANPAEDFLNAVALRRAGPRKERAPHAATAFERQQDVLKDGVIDVDGRRLELPANAQSIDLVFVEGGKVGVLAVLDFAAVRARAAGNQVEHSGLAGAVGADDHAQFPFIQIEVQIVNSLKAVEGFGNTFQSEEEWALAHGGFTGS